MRSEEPLSGRQRKLAIIASAVFVVAVAVAWYMTRGKSAADVAAHRNFICSETGKTFEHTIVAGESEPIVSPHSGKNTGYAAEQCYWTKGEDGKWIAKMTPTYVLLKRKVDPKSKEKTYCPDCGREVRPHNPLPPEKLMKAAEELAKTKDK